VNRLTFVSRSVVLSSLILSAAFSAQANGALGMNRQIFFAGTGGFDNHEDLVNSSRTCSPISTSPSARSSRRFRGAVS
jgi:hypothetical protein